MLKNEVVQTMSLNIKFSYLAENSKFSRSNSYFSILTPTFLRDGFLNCCFQNPSENSEHGTIMYKHHTVSQKCNFGDIGGWGGDFKYTF